MAARAVGEVAELLFLDAVLHLSGLEALVAGSTFSRLIVISHALIAYLDVILPKWRPNVAFGAERIPDPTTAGDFCRRFKATDVSHLIDILNDVRKTVWARQPADFFEMARIDMDGVVVETTGECKHGMDIAYDGTWGYHPLIVSLANTQEVLSVVNRPGNRPSHDGAFAEVDRAIKVCLDGGFREVRLRGDTDFSQTKHLDRWRVTAGCPSCSGLIARRTAIFSRTNCRP